MWFEPSISPQWAAPPMPLWTEKCFLAFRTRAIVSEAEKRRAGFNGLRIRVVIKSLFQRPILITSNLMPHNFQETAFSIVFYFPMLWELTVVKWPSGLPDTLFPRWHHCRDSSYRSSNYRPTLGLSWSELGRNQLGFFLIVWLKIQQRPYKFGSNCYFLLFKSYFWMYNNLLKNHWDTQLYKLSHSNL